MTRLILPLVLILTALAMPKAYAFDGLVTHIVDGDTLDVINETGAQERIRLTNADTPELKHFKWGYQPSASEARTSLLNLCGGKIATVVRKRVDRYGRTTGAVTCQGFDVATWQLDNGFAWPYHYGTPKKYKRMALTAKEKGLGLWALPNATDPYYWRKLGMH